MSVAVEESFLRYFIEAVGAVVIFLGGLVMRSHEDRLKKAEDCGIEVKEDVARFRLEAEQRFAKEVNVQASLSRLHDRLDEVGTDIKQLLARD